MAGAGVAFAQSPSADTSVPAGSAAPLTGETITVYNAQHESLTQAWADAFTRQSGIAVVLRNGDDSELGNQIIAEGAASPADVFLTENSPAMALVEQAGLFAPVAADTLAQVPAEAYRPSSGAWTGIAARSTVFAYNPTLLPEDQLPDVVAGPPGAGVEGPMGGIAVGCRLPGHRQRAARPQGRGGDHGVARGHEGQSVAYQGNGRSWQPSTRVRSRAASSTTTTGSATRPTRARTAAT